ncbi:MAG: hypothetical protein ACI9G1_003242 [Pirellulaceae bacterium]|jgi:hypothetical protein
MKMRRSWFSVQGHLQYARWEGGLLGINDHYGCVLTVFSAGSTLPANGASAVNLLDSARVEFSSWIL